MSDNVITSAGTADGVTFATDDDGTAHHPYVKLEFGADNTFTKVSTGNPLPVVQTGTPALPTGASTAAKQPALGTAGSASVDVISVQGIASGTAIAVSVASIPSHAVTNAGTFATQVDGAALTALQLIDNSAVDHDAASVAGVTQVGLVALSADPTAVTTGDASKAMGSLLGKQVTLPYAIPASTWLYAAATSGITNTSDVAAVAAGGAGVRHYVTSVQVINGHATVGTEVVIKDGSTALWRGYAVPVGGGCSAKFDPPLRGTANTAINVANITTGSATYFNLQGFDAKE